jgi:protein ImuB
VDSIGDLLALPRDGVARRFGQALLDELDRARGQLPDARALFVAPERYEGQLELPAPVEEAEALLFGARRLAVELCGFLQGRGVGITRLRCDLVHRDAVPTSIVLGLTSTRQLEHIMTVLRERLARETLPDRVEAVRLVAEEVAPLAGKDRDFFAGTGNAEAAPQLVERLRARLGEEAVRTLALQADHRPERAWRWESSMTLETKTSTDVAAESPIRPLWLLPDPHPIARGPAGASLQLESGPERIESGWWDGHDVARDYFVARNSDGEALWLYRDREGQWFVHGVFA